MRPAASERRLSKCGAGAQAQAPHVREILLHSVAETDAFGMIAPATTVVRFRANQPVKLGDSGSGLVATILMIWHLSVATYFERVGI